MRTLTAPATLVTGRTYTAPILLVTLTTVSGTVFKLSDYNRVIEGIEYAGLIQNPEDLSEKLNDFDGGGAPATARLALFNAAPIGGKPRFSDLIRTPRNQTGTYDFRNARVDIDRLESGQALADVVRLQSFYLEAPSDIGDALITLQMSDLALKIEDALPITKVTKAWFTKAPPSSIQAEIPRPFGVLKNVKARPVKDGAAGVLDASLTDVATQITLTDGTEFSNSGTGLIETEFVTWTGKSGLHILTGVTRAAFASTAAAHDAGVSVLEVLSEYIFMVGEGISRPLDEGLELFTNPNFDADVAGWSGSGTWDSGNGGQAKLLKAGLQNLLQTLTVVAGTTHTMRFTIRTSTIRLFVSDAPAGGGAVLYDVVNGPGAYVIPLVSSTTTMYCNFINGNTADAFLDSVSLKPLGTSLPIKAITNIRVNGRLARTSPVATTADTTLVPNRNFGTIKFTPGSVASFHLLGSGQAEKLTVTALTVTGDGATHLQAVRVITPSLNVSEVGSKTRRTISWTITTPTAFTNTNDWTLIRRPPGGNGTTDVIIGQGQGAAGNTAGDTWSGTDTREYPTEAAETILFQALLGSAKDITCTFNDVLIEHPEAAGGGGDSTASAVIGTVVCDLQGLQDDVNGTISGQANTLLENPADIARAILILCGLVSSDFDGTWATTRAILTTASYRWAFLLGAQQMSELRRKFSEQARARLVFASGRVGFRFRSYRPAADVVFQYGSAVPADKVAQALSVKISSPTELIAGLTVRYAFDDAKGEYQKSLTFGDPVAAAAVPPLELAFVADDTTARDLGAYWFGLRGRQRFTVDGTAWHNALALEQGDHFAVKGHPALVAHGDQNLIFSVLRKTDRGSQNGLGQITLGGPEDTIEGDVGPEDTSMAWGSRGMLAKNNAGTPNTKVDVTAHAVVLRNSANLVVIRHNPGSLTVDLTVAGPAANGRDQAGAHTASSWIHVYWIWDATNGVLALISSAVAPPTGPTFPTNFSYWGYVGAFYFNGSSQLVRTTICGSWASRTTVEALAAAVTDNTEHSIDGTAIWPPGAMRIGGTWGAILSVAGDSADLRPESGVDAGPHLETPGATTTGYGGGFMMNVTGQTIWYIQSANASRVWRVEINAYEIPNGGA